MALTPFQSFGQAVRERRMELGLSQEDAAAASDIDRAYFGHIERATKNPTLPAVWKIAATLGVKPSELLARAEHLGGVARTRRALDASRSIRWLS
jgi:transcriptional regulator with XRE-family HTH domain